MPYIDLSGKQFGRWSVIKRTSRKKIVHYLCKCSCGTKREVLSVSLRNGKSVSCGCYLPDKWAQGIRRVHRTTYISWSGMKQRCDYKGHIEYHRYGGRGISYVPRWKDFSKFLSDMGPKPDGTSLDRRDNNGMYCPENCKWSTKNEQSTNRSNNVFVNWEGERMALSQLTRKLQISYDLVHKWHRTMGLPIKDAVSLASKQSLAANNKLFSPSDLSEKHLDRT